MLRVLGVAYEPTESKMLAGVLKALQESPPGAEAALALADPTHIRWSNILPEKPVDYFPGKVFTYEAHWNNWQKRRPDPRAPLDLAQWERRFCTSRDMRILKATDPIINPWERSPYYTPLGRLHDTIVRDLCVWTEEIFDAWNPTCIISVNNQYLVKSLFFTIASKRNVPFLTLSHSRIGDIWCIREDFAYGTSSKQIQTIHENLNSAEALDEARNFLFARRERHRLSPSYTGLSDKARDNLHRPLSAFLVEFRLIATILFRHNTGKIRSPLRGAVYGSSQYRALAWHVSRLFRLGKFYAQPTNRWGSIEGKTYFYWPLHARPESSTLTLWDGEDEFEHIVDVAGKMPTGTFLAVKENPLMVPDRRMKALRQLRDHPAILLVDPRVSSQELIQGALGVIGGSGTALLEAAILGIPSYAMGKPEFQFAIHSKEDFPVEEFIGQLLGGALKPKEAELISYLAFVLSQGVKLDFRPMESSRQKGAAPTEMVQIFHRVMQREIPRQP